LIEAKKCDMKMEGGPGMKERKTAIRTKAIFNFLGKGRLSRGNIKVALYLITPVKTLYKKS